MGEEKRAWYLPFVVAPTIRGVCLDIYMTHYVVLLRPMTIPPLTILAGTSSLSTLEVCFLAERPQQSTVTISIYHNVFF